jgi:hypothetical protein
MGHEDSVSQLSITYTALSELPELGVQEKCIYQHYVLAGRKSVKKMQSILVPGAPPLWGTTAPFATIGPPLSC